MFVAGAFAGENVKAEIFEEHKNFVRARLVEVADASEDRTGEGEPPIPGMDKDYVKGVIDVDSEKVETGQRVVVCGAGLSGLDCALQLAMDGKDVTVVEQKPMSEFAIDASPPPRVMLLQLLEENGVKLIADHKVIAFTDEGVDIEDRNWTHTIVPCDTAVTAFGMKADRTLYDALREEIPDVYVIGDAERAGAIKHANHSAFDYALLA